MNQDLLLFSFFNPTLQLKETQLYYESNSGYYVGYRVMRDDEWVSIDYKA